MTFKDFTDRIEAGKYFNESELEDLYWDFCFDDSESFDTFLVAEEYGECQRWNHLGTRIYKVNDRYFACYADLGNTEMQMDEYYAQPEEVRPVEKTIIVYEPWRRIPCDDEDYGEGKE